jgi:hypothetical protein
MLFLCTPPLYRLFSRLQKSATSPNSRNDSARRRRSSCPLPSQKMDRTSLFGMSPISFTSFGPCRSGRGMPSFHMSLASDARGVSALFRLASFVLPCVQTWRSVWKTNEQSLDHCSASECEQDATISGEEPPGSSDIEANTANLSQYGYGNLLPAILKPNGPAKDRFRTC